MKGIYEGASMNILVTLDKNYLPPLKVMLGSLFMNNSDQVFDIYMIADGLDNKDVDSLAEYCHQFHAQLHPVDFDPSIFDQAPALRYYSRAMYYRLLAADLLPDCLDRILYLDPDILVINPIVELYAIDLTDYLMAAASHSDKLGLISSVNKARLSNYEAESYFNSGVLLMNLQRMRQEIDRSLIFTYIDNHAKTLLLPDQDALNALYGHRILELDDAQWNYDTRYMDLYYLASHRKQDIDWLVDHTKFLHFCGKNKPWKLGYQGNFAILYKHYQRLLEHMKK